MHFYKLCTVNCLIVSCDSSSSEQLRGQHPRALYWWAATEFIPILAYKQKVKKKKKKTRASTTFGYRSASSQRRIESWWFPIFCESTIRLEPLEIHAWTHRHTHIEPFAISLSLWAMCYLYLALKNVDKSTMARVNILMFRTNDIPISLSCTFVFTANSLMLARYH